MGSATGAEVNARLRLKSVIVGRLLEHDGACTLGRWLADRIPATLRGMATPLESSVAGRVLRPDDAGYAEALAVFNSDVHHTPELVVEAASAGDVVAAIRYAADRGLPVDVLSAGHAPTPPIPSGLVVSLRRMDKVAVDGPRRIAAVGGGARAGAVVAAAAPLGLAPVTGSSPLVGMAGLLLGGGLGPMARSRGFASDYLLGATVVTGAAEVVEADAERAPDLFWALRGGKFGLGIITELRVRLVELPALYAGSLSFAEEHIPTVLEQWARWTDTAGPDVTTSAAIVHFPPLDAIPEPFRGRRVLSLRFAHPGSIEAGERLARPLRAFGPLLLDDLRPLPLSEVARIHNDPTMPMPTAVAAHLLAGAPASVIERLLREVGPGSDGPFGFGELRHVGAATARDVPEGSAVGGRSGRFVLTFISNAPTRFGAFPAAAAAVKRDLAPYFADEGNINFVGDPLPADEVAHAWSESTRQRLEQVRRKYDPRGVLAVTAGAGGSGGSRAG